jgi:hypothetical protein
MFISAWEFLAELGYVGDVGSSEFRRRMADRNSLESIAQAARGFRNRCNA